MPNIDQQNLDPKLLRQAQLGDVRAQEQLYQLFAPQVLHLARHMLQCEATAEEVVQDTFIDVLKALPRFDQQGNFAAWLHRIAVNRALMQLRSAWWRKATPLQQEPINHTELNEQQRLHAAHDLNNALAALPAKTRAVLWLHDVEGYTHQEIAELMDKSVSFSKSQLARGHDKLKQQLNPIAGVKPCMPLLHNY